MHAVLAAAIANPRFARPYGSDRGDWGFEAGISGVDNFVRVNNMPPPVAEEMTARRRAKNIYTFGLN